MSPQERCHTAPSGEAYVGTLGPRAPFGPLDPGLPAGRFATHDGLNRLLLELAAGFGRQYWWPAATPFEVMVGAILVQNTAWGNVELAMAKLRGAGALEPEILAALAECEDEGLEALIRPSGAFRAKAKKLRALCAWLSDQGPDTNSALQNLAERPLEPLREELLGVHGVGPETADSILCYGLGRRSFVVDAIARRVLSRHGLGPEGESPDFAATCSYEDLRAWFEQVLLPDQAIYEEAHALFVAVAKDSCRVKSICESCPATTPV